METLADRKLAWINEQLDAGRTVYLTTYTRRTMITPAARKRWLERHGRPILKVNRGTLWLASGQSYVNATHCDVRAKGG